ncbi:hypothetical protein, partial [Ideonella azotifigens]
DADLTQAATQGDPTAFLAAARKRMAGRSLVDHALELLRLGRTSITEALRMASDVDNSGH